MSKGKYSKNQGFNVRPLVLVLAVALLIGATIGGTVAWLTASTETVENTFTVGDITIDLNEHVYNPAENKLTTEITKKNDNYKFAPGQTLPKDPYVTVTAGNEKCYLFIQATETNNAINGVTGDIIQYAIDDAVWTIVPEQTHVWYKVIDPLTANTDYNVLKDKQVKVSTDVTKEMKATLDQNNPKLSFKAYAIQYNYLTKDGAAVTTPEGAWTMVSGT